MLDCSKIFGEEGKFLHRVFTGHFPVCDGVDDAVLKMILNQQSLGTSDRTFDRFQLLRQV